MRNQDYVYIDVKVTTVSQNTYEMCYNINDVIKPSYYL